MYNSVIAILSHTAFGTRSLITQDSNNHFANEVSPLMAVVAVCCCAMKALFEPIQQCDGLSIYNRLLEVLFSVFYY
jgi:hypothetical protein